LCGTNECRHESVSITIGEGLGTRMAAIRTDPPSQIEAGTSVSLRVVIEDVVMARVIRSVLLVSRGFRDSSYRGT
jgi:hypothetical protein